MPRKYKTKFHKKPNDNTHQEGVPILVEFQHIKDVKDFLFPEVN